MSTLAVLGNTLLTTRIAHRLTRAGHTVRTNGLLGTDDTSVASTVQEAVTGAAVVLTSFDSAAATASAMTEALPAMSHGAIWLDIGPAAYEDTAADARAERHRMIRIAALVTEHRGILIATVPAAIDPHGWLLGDPILSSATDLVIRSNEPRLGLVGLEAQFGDLEYAYP